MNSKIATITIDLYQRGLLAKCEELDMESMCQTGDDLMDFLNEVQISSDPNITFSLTEKGKKVADLMEQHPELSLGEIEQLIKKGEENGNNS